MNYSAISPGTDEQIRQLEELVEERANRQLRDTLMIKGISESDQKKTWYEVEIRLSYVFSETLETYRQKLLGDWSIDVIVEAIPRTSSPSISLTPSLQLCTPGKKRSSVESTKEEKLLHRLQIRTTHHKTQKWHWRKGRNF